MKSFREIIQGATLVALMVTATLYVIPSVMAPADHLATTNPIASQYGVSINWNKDDLAFACSPIALGCFVEHTPTVIYVSPDLGDYTEQVILHELGHVMQYRNGVPMDECGADQFAALMGSDEGYNCK